MKQAVCYQRLWHAHQSGRLPHAILLQGPKGTNKAKLAFDFVSALFCRAVGDAGQACGACEACCLMQSRAHPDCLWVSPEASHAIKADQVRAIQQFVHQTARVLRAVVIHPADKMNLTAANALLKTLEEPPTGVLFILIHDQQGALPATILSRCQRFLLSPETDDSMAWLVNQKGREELFQALMHLVDKQGCPVRSAETLQHHDPVMILDCTLSWVIDVLKLQLNSDSETLINKDYVSHLTTFQKKTQLKLNVRLMEYVQHLRKQLFSGIPLNKQMMIESILTRWMESAACFS